MKRNEKVNLYTADAFPCPLCPSAIRRREFIASRIASEGFWRIHTGHGNHAQYGVVGCFGTFPFLELFGSLGEDAPFQVNPDAFRLNPNIVYMGGAAVGPSFSSVLSPLYMGSGSGMVNWQGASYKLNNGMRINLYGEYDADGHKVYNPSALPWQRNNFNAAFEMKSANGNFGIKLEVHGGRNNPY